VTLAAAEFGLSLRDPAWLALAALAPLFWLWRARQRPRVPFAAAALLDDAGAGGLPRTWRQRWCRLPLLLEALVLACAAAALARPVERLPLPPEREGIDVLLCVDASSSMAADDLGGGRSRHDLAAAAAAEFVRRRRDDRVGCVRFARYADLVCPPTLDHEAAALLLQQIRLVAADSPEDATAIGAAVALAATVLARSPARGKVVVVLTDGEENVATQQTPQEIAPLHAAQLCARLGVRVHSVVVGQGTRKDGRFVPLDTTAVRQLAATTGGRFFAARDGTALQQVYREIDALEKVAFAEPRVLVVEWFALPAALAVLLAALAHWCRGRWLEVLP